MIGVYKGRNLLNIRKGAGYNHPVVRTLEPGERVDVLDVDGEWAITREGYVLADRLELIPDGVSHVGAVGEPEIVGSFEPDDGSILEGMKVVELKALAKQSGIEIRNGMKKADIIAAIREA